jgi:hypothetical protein
VLGDVDGAHAAVADALEHLIAAEQRDTDEVRADPRPRRLEVGA